MGENSTIENALDLEAIEAEWRDAQNSGEPAAVDVAALVAEVRRLRSGAVVMRDVSEERASQDGKWGGPGHDDMHAPADWLDYIHGKVMAVPARFRSRGELRGEHPQPWAPDAQERLTKLAETPERWIASSRVAYRRRLVQIAALAVAAIESHDRIYHEDGTAR
jgi:hypothetical protein